MKFFDEILGKEEQVHEEVTPDKGVELKLEDPETFDGLFFDEEEGEE